LRKIQSDKYLNKTVQLPPKTEIISKEIRKITEAVERLSFTNMGDQFNVLIVPPAMAVKAAWPLEVRIVEKSKLLRMNKETL
jgi:hypothetical protein